MPESVTANDLLGAWRLVSWSLIYDDGRPPEFPLGEAADGVIMYTPDGHVSATLMRGGRAKIAPETDSAKALAYAESFAYAGRYSVRDGTVFHAIEVATNPALIGVTSSRHITLAGDRLTLAGPDFTPGHKRSQCIQWRRAG